MLNKGLLLTSLQQLESGRELIAMAAKRGNLRAKEYLIMSHLQE
jgi:hypothetical protein